MGIEGVESVTVRTQLGEGAESVRASGRWGPREVGWGGCRG